MNYFLWISGQEQGPYTLEQIQEAIDDGTISPQQTARTENDADWKPIHQIAKLKLPAQKPPPPAPQKTPPPSPNRDDFNKSTLAGIFQFFAVLNFIAGVIGLCVLLGGNSPRHESICIIAISYGIGGGFMALAFAKVIGCLHEMVFRLQNLERAAYHR